MYKFSLLQRMTLTALMVSFYIIATRFILIPVTDLVRMSLGLPILIFSSILLGPISGAIIGGCGDLFGALFVPYAGLAINPFMCLSYTLMGAAPGLFMILFKKVKHNEKIGFIILNSFLALIFALSLVFVLVSKEIKMFYNVFTLNTLSRLIIILIMFILCILISLMTYFINRHFKAKIKLDESIPSP